MYSYSGNRLILFKTFLLVPHKSQPNFLKKVFKMDNWNDILKNEENTVEKKFTFADNSGLSKQDAIHIVEHVYNYCDRQEKNKKGDTFTFYVRKDLERLIEFLEKLED